jgi:transposase-like protein
MGKKTHRTPPEVKADIMRRIKEEGITVAQAAKDHGLHETTVNGWLGAGAQGAQSLW